MTAPDRQDLVQTLGLFLRLVGEDGRAELRAWMLEHSDEGVPRKALRTMNYYERAFDLVNQTEVPRG